MLLITERDQIGDIFGHVVYKPAKTKKFVVPSTSYNFSDTKNEEWVIISYFKRSMY